MLQDYILLDYTILGFDTTSHIYGRDKERKLKSDKMREARKLASLVFLRCSIKRRYSKIWRELPVDIT